MSTHVKQMKSFVLNNLFIVMDTVMENTMISLTQS